jgi:hypothetical protein
MPSNEEWRVLLGRQDMTDEEVDAFVQSLRSFIAQALDDYFRDTDDRYGV